MSLYQIIEDANNQVKEYLSTLDSFTPEQVGLDARCRGPIHIDFVNNHIIIKSFLDQFKYYGRFGDIEDECVTSFSYYYILDANKDTTNKLIKIIDLVRGIVESTTPPELTS